MHTSIHKLNTIMGERMKQQVKFVQTTLHDMTLSHSLSPTSASCFDLHLFSRRDIPNEHEHVHNRDNDEESC